MTFAPPPANDFADFARTYWDACRERCPRIEGMAAKWTFEDLLPGMSDFDTRFLVSNQMTPDDWCDMSEAVGDVHLELCRSVPQWARNLEHLPGVNLTWRELAQPATYYPEYHLWTYYKSVDQAKLDDTLATLKERPWNAADEHFHLKKFCLYYGRYDRTIDRPINLAEHESKYPMHSRLMHYFAPPVHAAVCLLERQPITGKFQAFERARERFPDLPCWAPMDELFAADYRLPRWYPEPTISHLDDLLEQSLKHIAAALHDELPFLQGTSPDHVKNWPKALPMTPPPALVFFDGYKFSRLMKGRLRFYLNAPDHFDADWLIVNELSRIGHNFLEVPLQAWWQARSGEANADCQRILEALPALGYPAEQTRATRRFHQLACGEIHDYPATAAAICEIYDPFYHLLETLYKDLTEEPHSP